MNLKIDNEFRTLIPPLTAEEFSGLEALCVKHGITDSLKTWSGILVDGHNRYEIAQKHNLEFNTEEMEFSSRDDVKMWIIDNQLCRRNLDKWQRYDLVKQQEKIESAKARERQATSTGGSKPQLVENFPEAEKTRTRDAMGEKVGVSGKTYDKMKAIDKSDNEEVKQAVRNKEMSIDKAYREVKGLSPKKKSLPQTEVRNVEITVTNDEVMKNPIHVEDKEVEFIETEESHEEVEDVAKDATKTASLSYADDILSGITKIVNTVKYNRADVVGEICKLDCDEFNKGEFKDSLEECIKVLVRLKNGLAGY